MMLNWQNIRLGDIGSFKYGSLPKRHLVGKGPYPIFTGYCYQESYPQANCLNGDLIVVARGVGGTGDVKIVSQDCFLTNLSILMNLDNSVIYNKYIFYLFKNENLRYLDSGSAQSQITIKDLENVFILVPPLSEQRAIASVLSSLDTKIDLLHRQNATLEAMAEALFKQWFVVGAKEEWETIKLKDIFNIFIGRTPPRKEQSCFSFLQGNKWVSIKDMGEAGIFISDCSEYLTDEAVNKYNIPQIPANTVILSFKMTVGRVKITTAPMYSNEAIACFVPRNNYLSKNILYFFLKAYEYDSLGSTSSIVTAINSNIIKDIEIKLPPKNLIDRFTVFSDQLLNKIYYNQTQIRTLEKLRDSLLPKLMSGEVRVKF